ncbi:MAG TPA: hypothetical protein VF383_01185 [Candidatus Dormibacteraeota bacterium]
MALQDFKELTDGEPSLLRQAELIVLESHRRLYAEKEQQWSEPIAYHWLRYEDPVPVARLADGLRRLLLEGAPVDADAVDKACADARIRGFSY